MATSSVKYLRKTTRIEVARDSGYADPILDEEIVEEYEITRYKAVELLAATGGGTVLDLSEFGTIEDIIVHNRDGTNYVDTAHDTAPGGATDNEARVDAGKSVSLGDATPGSDLTLIANGAACEVTVYVLGTV